VCVCVCVCLCVCVQGSKRGLTCVLTSGHSHQLCNTEDSGFDEAVLQVDCGHRDTQ